MRGSLGPDHEYGDNAGGDAGAREARTFASATSGVRGAVDPMSRIKSVAHTQDLHIPFPIPDSSRSR